MPHARSHDTALQPDTSLRDLFERCPATRAVFNRYGLRGCGGTHGPAESVAFFASAHGVELNRLMAELRAVLTQPADRTRALRQLQEDGRPRLVDAIYRPFFLAGMFIVLTVGAAWGALMLCAGYISEQGPGRLNSTMK